MKNSLAIPAFLLVLSIWQLKASAAPNAVASPLERAEQAFAAGRYPDALKTFKSIATEKLSDQNDLVRWNILCARLTFATDNRMESEKCLREALKLNPDAAFDPYMDQPPFIAMWKTIAAELKSVSAVPADDSQSADDSTQRLSPVVQKSAPPFKRSVRAAFSLFPFGIGSFVNDEPLEGALFASMNLLAIVAPAAGSNCCGEIMMLLLPGVWGYEWAENVPRFGQEFPRAARVIDSFMPLFPFGAAQLRNGHDRKALTLAVTQLAFVTVISAGLQKQEQEWDRDRQSNYHWSSSEKISSSSESTIGNANEENSGQSLWTRRRNYRSFSTWRNALFSPDGYELAAIGWVGFLSSYAYGLYDGWYYQGEGEPTSPQLLKKIRLVPALLKGQQTAHVVPQIEIHF